MRLQRTDISCLQTQYEREGGKKGKNAALATFFFFKLSKLHIFLKENQNFNFMECVRLVCLQLQCVLRGKDSLTLKKWVGHVTCVSRTQHHKPMSCPMALVNSDSVRCIWSFVWSLQKDNYLEQNSMCWYFVEICLWNI